MPILAVSIKTEQGIPKRKDIDKNKKEKDFYFLGREAANLEKLKEEADAKNTTADLYSSIILAQSKILMNTVMMDLARLLAEIKMQNEMSKAILSQVGLNNTITPLNTQVPNAPFPPLPLGNEGQAGSSPFPPLPQEGAPSGLPNQAPPVGVPGNVNSGPIPPMG